MKALLKSGFCLALGWLANSAAAQDVPIKWQAASPKNTTPLVAPAGAGVRSVGLSQPTPLDGAFTPIVRMQAGDDKKIQPLPSIEIFVQPDDKPAAKPAPKPKEKPRDFTPPPPSPVFGGLGMHPDEGCFSDCCGPRWGHHFGFCGRDGCSDRPRFWASAEYLAWWQRGSNTPPLVTTSPAGTATINSGVIGLNTTTVLYDHVLDSTRSGGRFSFGTWCPHFCNLGIDGSFFFLGRQDNTQTYGGNNGNPQIARPIFNVITGKQGSELVDINNPDRIVLGAATVHSFSQLWGADINLRSRLCCGPNYFLDALVGYRYLNLREGIDVTENLRNFDARTGAAAGNFLVRDSFQTSNTFNGIQLGLTGEVRIHERFFIGSSMKLALGSVYQTVDINGSTTFTNFPAPFGGTFPGGLLALPGTNIGRYSAMRFGVLPEMGLKIGFDINDHWRVWVGYDALYLNNVVRPGDQIDLRVNPNFQPSAAGPGTGVGPRFPAPLLQTTNYWAQGINFGLMYRY